MKLRQERAQLLKGLTLVKAQSSLTIMMISRPTCLLCLGLDFANHSFDYNAAFDVDRKSKDFNPRLVTPVDKDEEITICYCSLTDDMSPRFMNLFFATYGFLPMRGFYS